MEQNKNIKLFDPYIKMMSTTNGRDKSLRFVQYLCMFLRGARNKKNVNSISGKILYTAWITRKVLRLGVPIFVVKKILNRIQKFIESPKETFNSDSSDDDFEKQPENSCSDDDDVTKLVNKKKYVSDHLKIHEVLQNSSNKGLAGHDTRMVITKTLKDISFIIF